MFQIHRLSYFQDRLPALKCLLSSRIHGIVRPVTFVAPDSPTAAQKTGKRGGEDLTHRDVRLSKSIRQKQAYSKADIPDKSTVNAFLMKLDRQDDGVTHDPSKRPAKTFRGVVIPEKPKPPESDECCMSGCAVCVYDLYLTSLESYSEAVALMRSTLDSQNVPVAQWPAWEKDGSMGKDPTSELDVSMSAFAQLERSLRETTQKST